VKINHSKEIISLADLYVAVVTLKAFNKKINKREQEREKDQPDVRRKGKNERTNERRSERTYTIDIRTYI